MQFAALEALLHLGPLCRRELGAKILKHESNMTTVIDNLEREDLVRREPDRDDRLRRRRPRRRTLFFIFQAHEDAEILLFDRPEVPHE